VSESANRAAGPAKCASPRHPFKWVRQFAGRAYYTVSSKLDAKPEELLAAALSDAERRGRSPICIAASFPLRTAEIAELARKRSVNAIVAKHGISEIPSLRGHAPEANLGAYWDPGCWMLPPGVVHVYLVGSWRLLTVAMLREAVRQQAVSLSVRLGRAWVDVPLDAIRRVAVYRYRMRPFWQATLGWWEVLQLCRKVAKLPFAYDIPRRAALTVEAVLQALNPAYQARAATQAEPDRGKIAVSALVPKSVPPLETGMLRNLIRKATADSAGDWVPGRVVLACGSLQPGGAERQLAYTAAGLAASPDIESVEVLCDLLTPNHPERYDFHLPLIERAGVPVRVVGRYAGTPDMICEPAALAAARTSFPEGLLLDIANLYQEFRRLRPEIVHAWLDWSNTRAGLAAALAGVPRIVLSGRNLNPTNFALYQPYMDPVYAALCGLSNVVMLNNSHAGSQSYAEWLGISPDLIRVVHNAFDVEAAQGGDPAAIRADLGIPPDAPVIGGVFRFCPEKRPLLWVETAARIARARPDAWFLMVGQGILRRDIETAARRFGIADRLLLPGVVSNVLPMMQAFDVFLLTSYGEGLPNVVIEAQWAGIPVVATKAGGVAEALDLGVTGWVIDPPDPDRLAERILSLLSAPEAIAQARVAGAALIRDRFGMRRMIDETVQVYSRGRVKDRVPAVS
jgi:glycosyltransferase involved in cell wall biosynthesis